MRLAVLAAVARPASARGERRTIDRRHRERLISHDRLENMENMETEEITLRLTRPDAGLLIESLDSHEYWQLGDVLPRKDGLVFIPGDMEPDVFWEDDEPTEEQRAAIDEVLRCRRLADRLRGLLDNG